MICKHCLSLYIDYREIDTLRSILDEKIYKTGKYRDFWFNWNGKPLLLYNDHPTVDAVGFDIKNPNYKFR